MKRPPLPCASAYASIGLYSSPVFGSMSTAWRWVNVPRRTSSPARRTVRPAPASEPKASSSAKPQSMPPSFDAWARFFATGATRGCASKPSGTSTCALPMACSSTLSMLVSRPWGSGCEPVMPVCSLGVPPSAERTSLNTASIWSWKSRRAASASSSERSPRPMRSSVYAARTPSLASMTSYIAGWVIDGSSASLWPRLR